MRIFYDTLPAQLPKQLNFSTTNILVTSLSITNFTTTSVLSASTYASSKNVKLAVMHTMKAYHGVEI
jgi:hypothetical protein